MSVIIVKQIKAIKNGVVKQVIRFNSKTNTLYCQNRSKDINMNIDKFLVMLGKTIDTGKQKGFDIIVSEVAENSLWSDKGI